MEQSSPRYFCFIWNWEVCTKNYRIIEFTSVKCFNYSVQSAVDARRQGDKNPNSTIVAETMELLANNSYGYQTMDGSRHSITKYLNDEKTRAVINNKLFQRLAYFNDQLHEVELVKSESEHKEPIIVSFFIPQYAKLGILELYYNFFSQNIATQTNTKKWKWIQTLST